MTYKIFVTREFSKSFVKLDASVQRRIDDEIEQLQENPFVGKPLGYSFFREKKVKGLRIYYLIYELQVIVFIVALSRKKDQQKIINAISSLIPYYKNIMETTFK